MAWLARKLDTKIAGRLRFGLKILLWEVNAKYLEKGHVSYCSLYYKSGFLLLTIPVIL